MRRRWPKMPKALEEKSFKLKKLLLFQVLDIATMREPFQMNGDARPEALGSRASEGSSRAVGAAGVQNCPGGPQDGALPAA